MSTLRIGLTVLALLLANLPPVRAETAAAPSLQIGDSRITVSIGPGQLGVERPELLAWIERVARAVGEYYDRFPVTVLNLSITPVDGRRLRGTAYRGQEPLIVLRMGEDLTAVGLQQDWILAHELVHLAFPPVQRRHHWLEEGLATYVEPLVRHHAGLLDETAVWHWLLTGTPKGLPQAGNRGLDFTPTWGQTYWGGALFCLLADLDIRRRSDQRYSLRDALIAILDASDGMRSERVWPVTELLAIGDRAVDVPVLSELYQRMRATPVNTDLEALWSRLGVALVDGRIVFDDHAPEAALRRTLTAAP